MYYYFFKQINISSMCINNLILFKNISVYNKNIIYILKKMLKYMYQFFPYIIQLLRGYFLMGAPILYVVNAE